MPPGPEQLGNAQQGPSVPAMPGTGRCRPSGYRAAPCEVGPGKFSPALSPQLSWGSPRPHDSLATFPESESVLYLLPWAALWKRGGPESCPGPACARHTDAVGTQAPGACPRGGLQVAVAAAGTSGRAAPREQRGGEGRGESPPSQGEGGGLNRVCPVRPGTPSPTYARCHARTSSRVLERGGRERQMLHGSHERKQEAKMARAVVRGRGLGGGARVRVLTGAGEPGPKSVCTGALGSQGQTDTGPTLLATAVSRGVSVCCPVCVGIPT